MFDRKPLASFGKTGAAVCIVYLVPITGLYLLLVTLYSNWVNGTVVLFQALWLFVYGPPLVALWAASIDRFRHGNKLKTLPTWIFNCLIFGTVSVAVTAVYALVTYPWLGHMHMGPAFAAIALVAAPALVPAMLLLKDHRTAIGA